MIEAHLRGKIPEIANREDCLTSMVFGLLKYAPMRPILRSFLGRASLLSNPGKKLVDHLASSWFHPDEAVDIRFWERSSEFGEPDLIFAGANWVVAVEVKLDATISGTDQLTKYFSLLNRNFGGKRSRHIVYLTKDLAWPKLEPEATRGLEGNLWWLSWYDLAPMLALKQRSECREMARDLSRLLENQGMSLFNGFSTVTSPADVSFWDDTVPLITEYDEAKSGPLFWGES